MSEFFRVASIAEYEPNISPSREIRASHSSLLVRDEVTSNDFSAAMLLGANFRITSDAVVEFVNAKQFSNSPENVGPALQLSRSPLQRQFFALAQSLDESGTPSRAKGVADHASNCI
jgi:hypothetical protein